MAGPTRRNPSPTPKTAPKVVSKTSSTKRRRSPTIEKDWYSPVKFSANVTRYENADLQPSLAQLVGYENLEPYVWITLAGETAKQSLESLSPLRRGLRYVELKNAHGKYPTVEFALSVPEYRHKNTEDLGDMDDIDPHGEIVKPLDKLIINARFSIQWGYRGAHISWGQFTVIERVLDFAEGTAILTIKAKMGARLTATTTSEVFSTTPNELALEKLANLCGQNIVTTEVDFSLLDNPLSSVDSLITAGLTVGQALHRAAEILDLEQYINPESDELVLTDPFKLDIVKKGAKPYKMTYGFPSSPIESLDIETKRPIKTGTTPRSSRGVFKHQDLGVDLKTRTARVIVKGSLVRRVGDEDQLIHFGYNHTDPRSLPNATAYEEQSAFSTSGDKATANDNVLSNAEKVWPPSKGYVVALNQALNNIFPSAQKNFKHVIVYKVVKISGDLIRTKDSLSEYQRNPTAQTVTQHWADSTLINQLTKGAISGGQIFRIQSDEVRLDSRGVPRVPVEVLVPSQLKQEAPKGDGATREDADNTTVTATPGAKITYDVSNSALLQGLGATPKVNTALLNRYKSSRDKKLFLSNLVANHPNDALELKTYLKYRDEVSSILLNQSDRETYRLDQVVRNGQTTLVLKEKRFVRQASARRPEEAPTGSEEDKGVADTASADKSARGVFTPASLGSGVGRPSRRLTQTVLTIKMKAGDWSLRVGRLIEIVDVYKSVNGIYYIDSEEHTIDDNGFHTTITCKKASSRQINSYGRGGIKTSKGKSSSGITKVSERPSSIFEAPHLDKRKEQSDKGQMFEQTIEKKVNKGLKPASYLQLQGSDPLEDA